jgi:hypothetical protein
MIEIMKKLQCYPDRPISLAFLLIVTANLSLSCKKEKSESGLPKSAVTKHDHSDHFSKLDRNFADANQSPPTRGDPEKKLANLKERLALANLDNLSSLSRDLVSLVKEAPLEVLAIGDSMPPGSKRNVILRDVFHSLPKDAALPAILWADKSAFREDKSLVKLLLNPNESSLPPRDAIDLAKRLDSRGIRKDLMDYVAWTTANPRSLNFAPLDTYRSGIPEEDWQTFRNQYAYGIIAVDVESATKFISNTQQGFSEDVLDQLGRDAGSRKGAELADEVKEYTLKHGEWAVFAGFVSGWMSSDSIAASTWVRSLDGDWRDRASLQVAKSLAAMGDADGAKAWVESISNPEIRPKN